MTSTRLPGKIFKKANGKTLLHYHISRLKQSGFDVAIATTTNGTDDCVYDFAEKNQLKIYRGSEDNVLSRFYETATKYQFDVIVRVTSDCPLIDPHLIRNSIEKYIKLNNSGLYLSNTIERTFARGFDFEVFSFRLLKEAYENACNIADLEHVTPYIIRNASGSTDFYSVKQDRDNSNLRITVDTPEDYQLIKTLIGQYQADAMDYHSIEDLLNDHAELRAINADIVQKKI